MRTEYSYPARIEQDEEGRYQVRVPPGRDVGAALAALSDEDLPAPRSTSGIATRANRGRPHRRHGPSTNSRTC